MKFLLAVLLAGTDVKTRLQAATRPEIEQEKGVFEAAPEAGRWQESEQPPDAAIEIAWVGEVGELERLDEA